MEKRCVYESSHEGVSGQANYVGEGRITINMLDLYLSERVKELTVGKQTPTTTKPETISDFPIALIKWKRCVESVLFH